MIKVIGVRFRTAGKIYFFDPLNFDIKKGAHVIVETARGIEFGTVVSGITEVEEEKVVQPLKPVLRIANERDMEQEAANKGKEKEAFQICLEKIQKHELEMKLIDAEYTFDNNKVLFYFTADGRIDFRELVKDLASVFKTRIELRQIGVRDETKIMGGIGICGRPLCCHSYLSDFVPVSIKMAKEQNLSLNPAKISGVCGRLMCCLKNEEETYEELNRRLPNIGDSVTTADGLKGEVQSVNVLRQLVKVIVDVGDEKEIKEYSVEQLQFKRKRGKKEKMDLSKEELEELERLEEEEKQELQEKSGTEEGGQRQNGRDRQDNRSRQDSRGYQDVVVRQGGREELHGEDELLTEEERTEAGGQGFNARNRQNRNRQDSRNYQQNRSFQEGGCHQGNGNRQENGTHYNSRNHYNNGLHENRENQDSGSRQGGRDYQNGANHQSGRDYQNNANRQSARDYKNNADYQGGRDYQNSGNYQSGRDYQNSGNYQSGRDYQNSGNHQGGRDYQNSGNHQGGRDYQNSGNHQGGRDYQNSANSQGGRDYHGSGNYQGGRARQNSGSYQSGRDYHDSRERQGGKRQWPDNRGYQGGKRRHEYRDRYGDRGRQEGQPRNNDNQTEGE